MKARYLVVALALVAMVFFVTASYAADKVHEGTVVKAGAGKLTMTDKDGKEVTHAVAPDAKITCDGKACKLEDLKAEIFVKVTSKPDDNGKDVALIIEAKTKK
jgi:hypothetical protein